MTTAVSPSLPKGAVGQVELEQAVPTFGDQKQREVGDEFCPNSRVR